MPIRSINPYNGQIIDTYRELEDIQIQSIISRSHEAYLSWSKTSYETRSKLLKNCAAELESSKTDYARIITLEMGKIIRESIAEVEKCAAVCRYYADNSEAFLHDEPLKTSHGEAYIHYNSIGPVLAVMPWNFPFWQVFRFAAPAVMAGNTALLKHASNVPGSALAIESAFIKAGFPEGIFQTLLIGSSKVSNIISHPFVKAVTLTGSEEAGGTVAECAGKNIKKSVLELGGSDPFIVMDDANIEIAAKTAVKARMLNVGQSCIAAKRFIVQEAVYYAFVDRFIEILKSLKPGDPMDENTDYGPLARMDLAEEIHGQVKQSLQAGAELLYGELPSEIKDAYYPPLVLQNIPKNSPAYRDEIFGPVASIFKFKSEGEAIAIANDSEFGLGASVWTEDKIRAKRMAGQIETGAVYCNQMMFSDPNVPFGGVKKSGYGRELSHLGIREFTNQKTVWIS